MPANAERDDRMSETRVRDLDRAARERLERDWQLPMNERLARLHELCKQITGVAGAAKRG
jgi:hypothetical protein